MLGDDRLWGRVVLLRPLNSWMLIGGALAVLIALMVFLAYAEYTRRVRVGGYLVPERGLVKVYASRLGMVERIYVRHGDQVRHGQRLFAVRTDIVTESDGDVGVRSQQELERQLRLVAERLAWHDERAEAMVQQHHMRLLEVQAQLAGLTQELRLQQQLVELAAQRELASREAYRQQAIAKMEYSAVREQLLGRHQRQQELLRLQEAHRREGERLPVEHQQYLREHQQQRALLQGQASGLRQRLAELSAERGYLVSAPLDGRVVSVRISIGERLDNAHVALALVPSGSELHARLFIPSHAIGFVEPDMGVRLRYRAFPHERYGTGTGRIARIGRALMTPAELKVPVALTEPSFVVSVVLDQQQLSGYGEMLPLQPGLLLDADISIDRRALWEWLLEPLMRLRGRL